jgi:phosphate transport system substrate-binding protein
MENRVLRETLMAFDSMAVIVPKDCKVKEVSLDVLRQIFSGQISNWEQLKDKPGPIQVIIPRAETTAHANFAAQVLGQNRFSPNSTLVHTAGSVIRAFRGRRAISFGSYGMVSGRSEIAVLKVDGRHPEEKDYPLRQELYFLTAGQPEGAVKRYVDFFLQGRGREFLQRVGMLPASQLERGRD